MIEAWRNDDKPGNLLRQGYWDRQRAQIERARWMLLEGPHRRTQPQSAKMGTGPCVCPLQLRLALVQSIEPVLDRLQPCQYLALKFVVHRHDLENCGDRQ